MNLLGTMHYSGARKISSKGHGMVQMAADKGNSISMLYLGYGYYYGNGLKKDIPLQ